MKKTATSKAAKKRAATSKAAKKKTATSKAAKKGTATSKVAKKGTATSRVAKKTTAMAKGATAAGESPSRLIDGRIAELKDWRGTTLARLRALIKQAVPDVVEEWKWRGVPVWSHGGILCTGETYRSLVKLTFLKGASVDDPAGLFNSSLEGNARRAIDIREGEELDGQAFKALVRAAAALNSSPARTATGR